MAFSPSASDEHKRRRVLMTAAKVAERYADKIDIRGRGSVGGHWAAGWSPLRKHHQFLWVDALTGDQ